MVVSRHHAMVHTIMRRIERGVDLAFGVVALVVGLSILATVPLLQVLCLGYLLVAGVRVTRGESPGRWFPGLHVAGRLGSLALGLWLWLWIPRLLASLSRDAYLLDPGGTAGPRLRVVATGLALLLGLHTLAAAARGGRLRHVLVPRPLVELTALRAWFSRSGYVAAREAVWSAAASFEPVTLLRTGLLGVAAAIVWLAVPTTLLALGSTRPVLAVLGAVSMAVVVFYLPFLQLRVADQQRLGALMDIEAVRRAHAGAPVAMAAGLLLTVTLTFPLYLLKVELIPREAMWLPGILFVVMMLPARLACGWALRRGLAQSGPRHRIVRALAWLVVVPVVLLYAGVLYATQYVSWYGTWSLYEQHAFLPPVPFFGL